MVIGFNIDDVIRNTSERIWTYYLKEYPNSLLKLEEVNIGDLKGCLSFETQVRVADSDENYEKIEESIEGSELFEEFFQDYLMEIYGSARDQYSNSNKDYNRLVSYFSESNDKTIIIQNESGKVKNSTLYFLSDRLLDITDITFVDEISEMWNRCDILVVANPQIIHYALENNKKIIKVKRWYNEHLDVTLSINEIKELFNLEIK